MKNKKTLIILISVIIVTILVLLIVLKIVKNKKSEEEYIKSENPELTTTLDIFELDNEKEFFTVENCINKYFRYLDDSNSKGVYNTLNGEYISKMGITEANAIQNTYQLSDGFERFYAKDMYYREISFDQEYQYFVYGDLLGKDYSSIKNIYIVINIDIKNNSFNITIPTNVEIDKQEYLNIMEELKKGNTNEYIFVKDQATSSIELNEYNEIDYYITTDPYALDRYLDNYGIMAAYYPEIAYELLDEEYRNKRFGSLEEYKKYVTDNEYRLTSATLSQYNISEKDGYYQYVLIDTNGNYYIFKVTGIMQYTLIGDFYTLGLEEIDSKYDESSTQDKVAINIQKVIAALSSKDYKYVYSKLADEFKANNYPTLESFETYISGKVYGNRKIEYKDFSNEGNVNICDISLVGSRASDGDPINMQIIMQLKDNRDFVMSFSIKE